MKIRAMVARPGDREFIPLEVDLDDPRSDEILVRIAYVGLCHTDVLALGGIFEFDMPAVFGHEGAGVVEKVGDAVRKVAPGDRVALSFRSCGACPKCKTGHPAYCHDMPLLNYAGMRPDGSRAIRHEGREVASNFFGQSSFATHALAYESNAVKIPTNIPLEIAAPLGCGIQTGAGSVIKGLACKKGSSLLITGGGCLGLSAVMGAKIRECDVVIVSEPYATRRAMALELGATHVIDPSEEPDLARAVRNILPSGVDYAIDTTGRTDVLDAIMNSLAPQGTLASLASVPSGTPIPGDLRNLLAYGHTIKGIVEGDCEPDAFIPEMIGYYKAGLMPIDRLISVYDLSDINQAIADQHDGHCIKAVLKTDQS